MNLDRLFELIASLRHPENGCPWDRAQTLRDMAKPLQDEAVELAEALEAQDPDAICEELGDVLWNLLFILELARESNIFTRQDPVEHVVQKMIERHPHVFGDEKAETVEEAKKAYYAAKRKAKER